MVACFCVHPLESGWCHLLFLRVITPFKFGLMQIMAATRVFGKIALFLINYYACSAFEQGDYYL